MFEAVHKKDCLAVILFGRVIKLAWSLCFLADWNNSIVEKRRKGTDQKDELKCEGVFTFIRSDDCFLYGFFNFYLLLPEKSHLLPLSLYIPYSFLPLHPFHCKHFSMTICVSLASQGEHWTVKERWIRKEENWVEKWREKQVNHASNEKGIFNKRRRKTLSLQLTAWTRKELKERENLQ